MKLLAISRFATSCLLLQAAWVQANNGVDVIPKNEEREAWESLEMLPAPGPCWNITKDTVVYEDLFCDCTGREFALVVVGPAALNLNGHKVQCSSGSPVFSTSLVVGMGARVGYGEVTGPDSTCIVLNGNAHRVKRMKFSNCLVGIAVFAPRSKIATSVFSDSANGIALSSAEFSVVGNKMVNISSIGIRQVDSANGTIQFNHLQDVGIGIAGLHRDQTVIRYNTVRRAVGEGISVGVRFALVQGNRIIDGANVGLSVNAFDSVIVGNVLSGNGLEGIRMIGGNNLVKRNIADNNGLSDATVPDYTDASPNCGTNTWISNKGTGNQVCID